MASVEIQTPDGVMRVRLDGDHYTIGRLATSDIALPYPHISRQHAELLLKGQTWWVVDLHSTNGLHIGGQRVSESKLTLGAPVMLSPLIIVTLLHEAAASHAPQPMARSPQAPPPSQPSGASYPSGHRMRSPIPEPITPLSALGPRSPYADDEAPFYPQMRPMQPEARSRPTYAAAPNPLAARPGSFPPGYAPAPMNPQAGAGNPGGFGPQQQAALAQEQRRRATAGPSPLLHVCQTCGQRTPPDAVYCQSCHHAIASECMRCRLSLLPIQDACPRCQTPNPSSVRRARLAGGQH